MSTPERIARLRRIGCGLPAGRDLLDQIERRHAYTRSRDAAVPCRATDSVKSKAGQLASCILLVVIILGGLYLMRFLP